MLYWIYIQMKLIVIGLILIILGAVIFFFYPVLKAEIDLFLLNNDNFQVRIEYVEKNARMLTPVDTQFGIVINKIAANAKVIDFDEAGNGMSLEFALLKGLVHPTSSASPGSPGNVVIYAQTPGDWYKYTRSNPQFYLINKLVAGDIIEVFYRGEKFNYQVTESFKMSDDQIQKFIAQSDQKELTILSGWPPGTQFVRLIVQAKLVEPQY